LSQRPTLCESFVLALLLAVPLALGAPVHAADGDTRPARRPIRASELTPSTTPSATPEAQAAAAATQEAVARLEELAGRPDFSEDQRAEMRLRLADRYLEQARAAGLREVEAWEVAYNACFDAAPACDPATVTVDGFRVTSTTLFDKGIRQYRRILADTPAFARADEAQFYLGFALREIGRVDEANEAFTRLVKTAPASAFVPDAYLLIGEYFFDRDDAYKALVAYQRAAAFPDHDKYLFSLYKLGWCYYNVAATEDALAAMRKVVRGSMAKVAGGGAGAIQLQEEALRDLMLFYADLGDLEDAERFLADVGRTDLVPELLDRAATRVFEQGKYDVAITTWRRLLAADPLAARAPLHHQRIVDALRAQDRKEDTLAELARFRDSYGKASAWARANATNTDALATAPEILERQLRTVATQWHTEGRKLRVGAGATRVYGLAERAYAGYLTDAGPAAGPHTADMRYGYAELLYATGKPELAFDQYMAVVALDPQGAHARFCAESAIFAAEQAVKREAQRLPAPPVAGAAAVPLTPWEERQLAALDQYVARYPDAKTKDMTYRAGYLLYGKNQFVAAAERFNRVIALDPRSREAEQAANLMLDSFALVGDWDALRANARAYRDQAGLGSEAFKREVATIYENASLKGIEAAFAARGDAAAAADAYLAWDAEFPGSANGELALQNAAVHLTNAGRAREALAAREALVARFPRSKHVPDAVAALGFGYESLARFDVAAGWYERLATNHPTHADAPDACVSAALFRASLGQWEAAAADYQRYVATWPARPDAEGARLAVAELYEAHGIPAEAAAIYQRFFTKPAPAATVEQVLFARLRYGLVLEALGQGAKVPAHWRESLAVYDAAPDAAVGAAPVYAAQMRFALADLGWAAYAALAIDGPGAGRTLSPRQTDALLEAELLAKVRALAALEKAYAAVVTPGAGEWAMAAAARIGAAHEEMSAALAASYVPAYLTPDQREIYRMGLEDRIYAENQKAADAWLATLRTSQRLSVYTTHTADAVRRLAVLRPDAHPLLAETLLPPRYVVDGSALAAFEER